MESTLYVLPRGGFGNILFNVLIGYSLSVKYKLNLVFYKSYEDKRRKMDSYNLFKNLKYTDHIVPGCYLVREPSFFYFDIVLESSKNYLLDGYFQSYKYSRNYIPEIKKLLQLPESLLEATMLHVRRGDYLEMPNIHPVQTEEYFKKALDIISPSKILVFSDDMAFVKNWKILTNYNCEFIDKDVEECFKLMMQCKNFIISNSSLSLLAYLLRNNQDAKLCIPQKWFGPDGPRFSISDLVEITDNVRII
jgi:hypothetical protein